MPSKVMTGVDRPTSQASLPLVKPVGLADVPMSLITRVRSFTGAIALTVQLAGLDEKEVYIPLGIDAGHWTRITNGQAHFPVNKLNDLCDLCGNEAVLIWWAWSRNKGLVMLQTEAERRIAELEAALAKSEERRQWAEDIVTRRAP